MTADGMIARSDGRTDWILTDQDYEFETFFKDVDTLIMGRKTFEKCLSLGPWPYDQLQTYVFSRSLKNDFGSSVTVVDRDPSTFIEELKEKSGNKIWLVGGAEIIKELMSENLVDQVIFNIHKEILGQGIQLFPLAMHSMFWTLESSQEYPSGVVQTRYVMSP